MPTHYTGRNAYMSWYGPEPQNLPSPGRVRPLTVHDSMLVAGDYSAIESRILKRWGARADARRRPGRVAKKFTKRLGFRKYASFNRWSW